MESTNNFLQWVDIKNFKSIKDLRVDCKRVNVFIGKPNVGKSNILEGLALLGASLNHEKYLSGAVRYEELRDLFYDSDPTNPINVFSNQINTVLQRSNIEEDSNDDKFALIKKNTEVTYYRNFSLTSKGKAFIAGSLETEEAEEKTDFEIYRSSQIKKYDFLNISNFKASFSKYLLPHHGYNLYAVINKNKNLWEEVASLFKEQNLEFVLIDREQRFVLQRREGHVAKQYPYFSIADTFRRFIFYITAIESNKDSVIIFEEPEVHSFPPYTQELAYRMIYDENNQYFISTHSPYMLHPFIEKMNYSDLNVFITYYKDYETHVRALTEEELRDILDYSTNIFFNLDKFEPNA
ncbi:ATP/GTP-binding protein [Nibrella saemangeumensis]|uniref:ATP/GTP-binding protein n=2 Tax=Nibrella saemangeumensis TaxID=1084526 RepID=A0ABP8M9V3_9BACT